MSKEYVECLFLRESPQKEQEVLLILKDRPENQKNKLNLPGGRIEEGETPEQCVVREIKEETGLDAIYIENCGIIKGEGFLVHCFYGSVYPTEPFSPREGETEQPIWMPLHVAYKDKRLIPNLRVIIPMLKAGIKGFVIEDNLSSEYKKNHKFVVSVPTFV